MDPLRPIFRDLLDASTVIPAFSPTVLTPILTTSFGLAIINAISVAYPAAWRAARDEPLPAHFNSLQALMARPDPSTSYSSWVGIESYNCS